MTMVVHGGRGEGLACIPRRRRSKPAWDGSNRVGRWLRVDEVGVELLLWAVDGGQL